MNGWFFLTFLNFLQTIQMVTYLLRLLSQLVHPKALGILGIVH